MQPVKTRWNKALNAGISSLATGKFIYCLAKILLSAFSIDFALSIEVIVQLYLNWNICVLPVIQKSDTAEKVKMFPLFRSLLNSGILSIIASRYLIFPSAEVYIWISGINMIRSDLISKHLSHPSSAFFTSWKKKEWRNEEINNIR